MTSPKTTLRPRRRSTVDNLPHLLVAWFEGAPGTPWAALIYPDWALLPDRWRIWKASHPDARPPGGFEWLDDPTSPRHPPAWVLAQARKYA